jgi:1,4-dihydroxy-2-naphthoyl-CoA synthase
MDDIVLYEKEGDIGKITLNKPDQRNTIDLDVLKKLIEYFKLSAKNEDVCVIYAANGKHFTVGADLKYSYDLITNKDKLDIAVEFLESWQILTRGEPGVLQVCEDRSRLSGRHCVRLDDCQRARHECSFPCRSRRSMS